MTRKMVNFKLEEVELERAKLAMAKEGFENFSEWIRALIRRHVRSVLGDVVLHEALAKAGASNTVDDLDGQALVEFKTAPVPQSLADAVAQVELTPTEEGFHVEVAQSIHHDPEVEAAGLPQLPRPFTGSQADYDAAIDSINDDDPEPESDAVEVIDETKEPLNKPEWDESSREADRKAALADIAGDRPVPVDPTAEPVTYNPAPIAQNIQEDEEGVQYWDHSPEAPEGREFCMICRGEKYVSKSGQRMEEHQSKADAVLCGRCDGSGLEPEDFG